MSNSNTYHMANRSMVASDLVSHADDVTHEKAPHLPLAAKLVAGVCIVTGLFSVLEIVLSIVHQAFHFNLGIQGIFIGWGLLRRRKFFWWFALAEVWVSLIGFPLLALYLWTRPEVPTFPLLGRQIVALSYWIAAVACFVAWLIAVWEYWVLNRPDVRAAFGIQKRA